MYYDGICQSCKVVKLIAILGFRFPIVANSKTCKSSAPLTIQRSVAADTAQRSAPEKQRRQPDALSGTSPYQRGEVLGTSPWQSLSTTVCGTRQNI